MSCTMHVMLIYHAMKLKLQPCVVLVEIELGKSSISSAFEIEKVIVFIFIFRYEIGGIRS